MVNLSRINKFGGKKQNSEDESVVELTSCIIEVFLKSEKTSFDLHLHDPTFTGRLKEHC